MLKSEQISSTLQCSIAQAISTLDKNVSTQQLKLHSIEVTVESFNLIAGNHHRWEIEKYLSTP